MKGKNSFEACGHRKGGCLTTRFLLWDQFWQCHFPPWDPACALKPCRPRCVRVPLSLSLKDNAQTQNATHLWFQWFKSEVAGHKGPHASPGGILPSPPALLPPSSQDLFSFLYPALPTSLPDPLTLPPWPPALLIRTETDEEIAASLVMGKRKTTKPQRDSSTYTSE